MGKIYSRGLFPNKFCSKDVVAKAHPYLGFDIEKSLIVDNEEDYNYYTKENSKDYEVNGETISISQNLIRDVLSYESLFSYYWSNCRVDNSLGISLIFVNKEGLKYKTIIPKAYFAKAISDYVNENVLEETSIEKTRMHFIEAYTTETVAFNRYLNYDVTYNIEGENITFNGLNLLRVILDEKLINKLINNEDGLYGISKEKITYATLLFVEKEQLFKKYIFDQEVYNRYKRLKEYKYLDFESINRLNKSDDILPDGTSIIDNIVINKSFYQNIMKYNNPTYSKLEQAIYIYIRLCDLLVIDEEHYRDNINNELQGKHNSLDNINNLSETNNTIVSYEFALLYAKLLRDLGITYSTTLNSFMGYSKNRSLVRFKQGEYIVLIDLFKDMLVNDFKNVKNNKNLSSIICENTNVASKNKFNEILYEVYKNYSYDIEKEIEQERLINEYRNKYLRKVDISKREKLFTMLKLIGYKKLKGNDSIDYINDVYNMVVGNDYNYGINILFKEVNNHTRPIVIISIKEDEYKYILVDTNSNDTVRNLSKVELYDYLTSEDIQGDLSIGGLEDDDNARTIKVEGSRTTNGRRK